MVINEGKPNCATLSHNFKTPLSKGATVSHYPEGWKYKRLDQLVSVTRKITYGIVVPGPNEPNGNLMIRAQDYSRGWGGLDKIYRVSDKVHASYKRSQVREHDVLLTIVGSIGNTAIVPLFLDGANLTQQTARLAFDEHDPFYYHAVISSFIGKREVYRFAKSGVQPSLNLSDVAKFRLPVPPLPEQRKIAKILSTWDKAIATTEKLITASKQQKKALMQQLLTGKKRLVNPETGRVFEGEWDEVQLNEVAKVTIGLVTTMTKHYSAQGVPLIRNSDIKQNEIRKEKLIYLTNDFASEHEHRKLCLHDVVTVHTGEVGVSAVIKENMVGSLGFATLNSRPNIDRVFPDFLSWYFNSDFFVNWCVSMSTGDGRQNLNLKDFVKAKINLPKLEEQQKIAQVLTAADQEIEHLESKLAYFQQEKKALMQQLLTGKRRVKVDSEVETV